MDMITLSFGHRVFLYRGFLSEEECDYLLAWVLSSLLLVLNMHLSFLLLFSNSVLSSGSYHARQRFVDC